LNEKETQTRPGEDRKEPDLVAEQVRRDVETHVRRQECDEQIDRVTFCREAHVDPGKIPSEDDERDDESTDRRFRVILGVEARNPVHDRAPRQRSKTGKPDRLEERDVDDHRRVVVRTRARRGSTLAHDAERLSGGLLVACAPLPPLLNRRTRTIS
jgi:hypothetical protein